MTKEDEMQLFKLCVVVITVILLFRLIGCDKSDSDKAAASEMQQNALKQNALKISDRFNVGMEKETLFLTRPDEKGRRRGLIFQKFENNIVQVKSVNGIESYPLTKFSSIVDAEHVYPPREGNFLEIGMKGVDGMRFRDQFKARKQYIDLEEKKRTSQKNAKAM